MAINIPLVHISDLTEKTSISDDEYMLTGGSTASKVKWSTIVSLIKTKLGIGNIESNISKIQSDISTLNSDLQYKEYGVDGCSIQVNGKLALVRTWYGGSLTGGNVTQTLLTLPDGITFNTQIFAPCEILNGAWTPYGNTGYITLSDNTLNVRCKDTISYGVVMATVAVPASYITIS